MGTNINHKNHPSYSGKKRNRWGGEVAATAAARGTTNTRTDADKRRKKKKKKNHPRPRLGNPKQPHGATVAAAAANAKTAATAWIPDTAAATTTVTTINAAAPAASSNNNTHTKRIRATPNTKTNRWVHLFFGQPTFRNDSVFSLDEFEFEQ